ncbi:GNAT family N-acetyltransferase [Auraticoccus cholistanensis]
MSGDLPAVGERVSLRYRITGPGPGLTDAVGDVLAVDGSGLLVRTRRGEVRVERSAVVAWRRVPPPPGVPALHRRADAEELSRLAARGWPAVEEEALGDWRLRWADGWTRRANSVLATGGPGRSLAGALHQVRRWYRDRGRPALLQLSDGALAPVLEPELVAQGFTPAEETCFLTATAADVARDAPGLTRWSDHLEPEWLAAFARQRPVDTPAAATVLAGSGARFARIEQDGRIVAVGRLTTEPPWAGLTGLWVEPASRGRGLGTALTADLAVRAVELGCAALHLQVLPDNTPALALYRRLGFEEHHRYRYWSLDETAPTGGPRG